MTLNTRGHNVLDLASIVVVDQDDDTRLVLADGISHLCLFSRSAKDKFVHRRMSPKDKVRLTTSQARRVLETGSL